MDVRAKDPLPVAVGVDGPGDALRATRWAAREAARWQVPLVVVHAIDLPDLYTSAPPSDVFMAALRKDAADVLRHATDIAKEDADVEITECLSGWAEKFPRVTVERVVVRDTPRDAMLDLSERAQLVVVGSRGRGGFSGVLLGSMSQALIHYAACPVMIARSAANGTSR